MLERPSQEGGAVLVHIDFHSQRMDESLLEFEMLASSAGAETLAVVRARRKLPDAATFVGSGKLAEIADIVKQQRAGLVLFNHALSPVQERNVERALGCRVVDRIGLILDIFAQRAQTFEGKLQVELAQLEHLSTRLVRGWSHLERQKGGIGLRGPGETQLETDRRLLGQRIKVIKRRLDKVSHQRGLRRQARRRAAVSTISLVGYTNAGKSTLFNHLTGANVYQADQLFATLDPTLRRIDLPPQGHLILADTVGFIRHLPHKLVAAFRATLEETVESGLLLHVVDAHDDESSEQIEQVNAVLSEIGADRLPQIEIFNKIDLLSNAEPRIDRNKDGRPTRIWLSAETGAGTELLIQVMREYLSGRWCQNDRESARCKRRLHVAASAGRLHASLYAWELVESETTNEHGDWLIDIFADQFTIDYLLAQEGCHLAHEPPPAAVD